MASGGVRVLTELCMQGGEVKRWDGSHQCAVLGGGRRDCAGTVYVAVYAEYADGKGCRKRCDSRAGGTQDHALDIVSVGVLGTYTLGL